MSTTELKYNLFKIIDAINDNKALKDIYSFVSKKSEGDFMDSLTAEQRKEIETALEELDNGKGVPHKEVMAKYKGKYI